MDGRQFRLRRCCSADAHLCLLWCRSAGSPGGRGKPVSVENSFMLRANVRRFYKPFRRFSSDLTMAPIQVSSHHRMPVILPRSKYRRDELTRIIVVTAWLFIG